MTPFVRLPSGLGNGLERFALSPAMHASRERSAAIALQRWIGLPIWENEHARTQARHVSFCEQMSTDEIFLCSLYAGQNKTATHEGGRKCCVFWWFLWDSNPGPSD
jgi:hypothetical protein